MRRQLETQEVGKIRLGKALTAAVVSLMMSMFLLAGCASDKVETSSSDASSSSSHAVSSSATSSSDEASGDKATAGSSGAGYGDYDEVMVTIEIDPSAAAGKTDADTTVFGPEEVFVVDGGTAYDALAATGVKIEGDPSYVTSIDGLAAGAVSSTSGWMYKVNGENPTVAANEYVLSEGDQVIWYYVDSFE